MSGVAPAGESLLVLNHSEVPRAYAHGILGAKLRLHAGVYSSGNFPPQAHACGIADVKVKEATSNVTSALSGL